MSRHSLLFLCLLASRLSAANENQWFTDKPRELKALRADPREAQAKTAFLYRGDKRKFMDFGFGGNLGLFRRESDKRAWAVNVRGLSISRFEMWSGSFDYQGSDFVGGLAASMRKEDSAWELLVSHQSSHIGHDVSLETGRTGANFSFESARILYSNNFTATLRAYGGTIVIIRAVPSRLLWKVTPLIGADWHFVPDLFTAFDMRFKGENDFSPNLTWVVGYELGDVKEVVYRQRVFIEIFNGYSNQGQFSDEREFYLSFGIAFTL